MNKSIKDRVVEYNGSIASSGIANITCRPNGKYHLNDVQVCPQASNHDDEEIKELYDVVA